MADKVMEGGYASGWRIDQSKEERATEDIEMRRG
jgi:hypothetical protein